MQHSFKVGIQDVLYLRSETDAHTKHTKDLLPHCFPVN